MQIRDIQYLMQTHPLVFRARRSERRSKSWRPTAPGSWISGKAGSSPMHSPLRSSSTSNNVPYTYLAFVYEEKVARSYSMKCGVNSYYQ